ncbi:MAG: YcxB family protein [Erythrobacter sp.]|nr:YcxB family protein [Erythrobacter sp.]
MRMHGPYTYRVDEADLASAGRHFFRRKVFQRPMNYLVIAIIGLAIVLVALDLFEDGALRLSTLLVVGLGIPLIWLIPYLLAPVIMRRQFRQSAALRDENQLEFDEEAVRFTNQRGHARIPFHELYAWSETDRMILLHQTEAFFNPIPKASMGDDYLLLVSALEEAGIRRF